MAENNAEAGPSTSDEASNTNDDKQKVVASPPNASASGSASGVTDYLVRLRELKALCRMLISPEAPIPLQLTDKYKCSNPQERLFLQQQEEQERRRRFLQPNALRYCPMMTTATDISRLLQPTDAIRSVALQAKFNILNKCGTIFTAMPENVKEKCTICLQGYELNDNLRKLKCSHVFHQSCIDRWIWKEISCPICRSNVLRVFDYGNNMDYRNPSTSSMDSLDDEQPAEEAENNSDPQ